MVSKKTNSTSVNDPAAFKERLLDEVFVAPNCAGGLGELLDCVSQKRHRPVEMMKLQAFGSRDEIILAPALRGPITSASNESVQHRQIDRSFDIKLVLASL